MSAKLVLLISLWNKHRSQQSPLSDLSAKWCNARWYKNLRDHIVFVLQLLNFRAFYDSYLVPLILPTEMNDKIRITIDAGNRFTELSSLPKSSLPVS